MNAVHLVIGRAFDLALTPFELLGNGVALVLVSGMFGVLALLLFKRISWQEGIKRTKDRIKGHMIAIRIYQDDLGIVFGSVMRVVMRNFQYLVLNFGPILPLFIPFVLIASQLVVRYAFDPLPVVDSAALERLLPGKGVELEVRMKPSRRNEVAKLEIAFPGSLSAVSPVARIQRDGIAVVEFVAVAPGSQEIVFSIEGRAVGSKTVVSGMEPSRSMQPERVSSFWASWLWPAEPTLPDDSPIESVRFTYPERHMGFLPGGPLGVLLTFFVASILFGVAILKPLNIQI